YVSNLSNVYDVVFKYEEQIDSKAGERGARFFSGEQQRISIARAIYKSAPILILDEATSALDSKSEQEVQKALEYLIQGKTVFVVAHRLSTIINSDRIIVMKDGRVVEAGSHSELLAKKGTYYNFYQIQAMS